MTDLETQVEALKKCFHNTACSDLVWYFLQNPSHQVAEPQLWERKEISGPGLLL